jgi:hypothetical protein
VADQVCWSGVVLVTVEVVEEVILTFGTWKRKTVATSESIAVSSPRSSYSCVTE